jgi:predicted nucleic acid-binding protein
MRGLLDTSVFIAGEQGRPVGELPDEAAISVMTLAELHVGVLVAEEAEVRAQRLRTLASVERAFEALPVDDSVARSFAGIVSQARKTGRRPKIVDALIAATALAADVPIYTQDADFAEIPGLSVVLL